MKRVKVKLPENKAEAFADFLASNGIVTVLSWGKTDGFFDFYIFAIIVFKDELVETFTKSEWNNHVVKS